jgi:predicted ATPase
LELRRTSSAWGAATDAPAGPPHGLPLELSSFVGRSVELARLSTLLEQHRLVTLAGTGGVGKTRLAIRAGERSAPAFDDGVWFVDLGPVAVADLVPQTVSAVLNIRERAGAPLEFTLVEALRTRRLLLILDNAEHQLPMCAQLIELLLRLCPRIHVLVTTREPLRVSGEVTMDSRRCSFQIVCSRMPPTH